jgi:hypothetical protein
LVCVKGWNDFSRAPWWSFHAFCHNLNYLW